MIVLIAGAVGVFVATNLDGLLVLTVLFATPGARWQSIVAGEYLGVTVLVFVSAALAIGLLAVPKRLIGLGGIIPVVLGIRMLLQHDGSQPTDPPVATLAIAVLVIANGADNVAVYTPTFRNLGPASTIQYILAFVALAAVWCALGSWLAHRKPIARAVERSGHILVPAVFIIVGAALLATTL
jgi:cadmium resistance protein CadD (predicted permease)